MLLNESSFEIIEKKTQKRREVRINNGFQKHIIDCYNALFITDKSEKYLKSSERRVYSIQRINMLLKDIKKKYGIKSVKSFSTHSLRQTFGPHGHERADSNGEMALVMLSELFNHSNIAITKRYLGLRKEEILKCYDLLDF